MKFIINKFLGFVEKYSSKLNQWAWQKRWSKRGRA
jgi:hypothetical protein|tara:strand:- start:609 stop:713 length:105 start_codon:yes stop_codon:yes gene_type:complete